MLLGGDWRAVLLALPGILFGLVFHEFAHGYVADRLGDSTAREAGRLTLNPLAHLDPFGTLLLVLVGFGWAKPTPINPQRLRHPRRDEILVTAAGPLTNLLLAFLLLIAYRFSFLADNWIASALLTAAALNVFLGIFNLLPIPPLDGSHILLNGLGFPEQWKVRIQQVGSYLLIVLLFALAYFGNPLGRFSSWVFGILAYLAGAR
ncbi:MAG: site-2 protease family protein [Firmicutes bacterium]|nr:site-2 protease family protein [Bacillota bacterium]